MEYPGGKNGFGAYQTIVNQIPPHKIYIEPFLGSGAVLRHKRPAELSFGLDMDSRALESFCRETGMPMIPFPRLSGSRISAVAQGCALEFLNLYPFKGGEFVYLDPPYLKETRRSERPIYRHEFWSKSAHERLLSRIVKIAAPVAISGYASSLYGERLKGWRRIDFATWTHAGPATESLWCNYPEPKELHDYRFLGKDRTERQRIKRKKARWKSKLEQMPPLERYAILSAIAELSVAID